MRSGRGAGGWPHDSVAQIQREDGAARARERAGASLRVRDGASALGDELGVVALESASRVLVRWGVSLPDPALGDGWVHEPAVVSGRARAAAEHGGAGVPAA